MSPEPDDFEWTKDERDDLVIYLYDGHQTATISDANILPGLNYFIPKQGQVEFVGAVQLALSSDQSRKLGEHLLRAFEAPHIPRPLTDPKH
jgi:hypothetical protein